MNAFLQFCLLPSHQNQPTLQRKSLSDYDASAAQSHIAGLILLNPEHMKHSTCLSSVFHLPGILCILSSINNKTRTAYVSLLYNQHYIWWVQHWPHKNVFHLHSFTMSPNAAHGCSVFLEQSYSEICNQYRTINNATTVCRLNVD